MSKKFVFSFFSLLSGLVFGIGLIYSGLADPNKVLAFLDVTGSWDPSLASVMVGAIGVTIVGFAFATSSKKTLLNTTQHFRNQNYFTKKKSVDVRLVVGSALFGLGWGIAGICPGPAFVLLTLDPNKAFIFFFSLISGFVIYAIINKFDWRK